MAKQDRETQAHKEWLGFLQPVGVVVSPPALIKAQAFVNRNIIEEQQHFQTLVTDDEDGNAVLTHFPAFTRPVLTHFPAFTRDVLRWYEEDLSSRSRRNWRLHSLPPSRIFSDS